MTLFHKLVAAALLSGAALLAGCAQNTPPQEAADDTPGISLDHRPIAVQLYTLRNIPALEDRLKLVKQAGLSAVETVGTHDLPADELKALLDQYAISATSMHVLPANLRTDLDSLIAFNKVLGNDTLVVAWLPENERPSAAAGWTALGQELGQIAERLDAEGMQLAYHNHDFELVDFDGQTGLDLLFAAAGSKLKAEIDVAWVNRAGLDPASLLGAYSGRVFAIHAKDNAPEGQGEDEWGFAAVGTGVLNWGSILPTAAASGVKWYIIEHDLPKDPAAVIHTGAQYLNQHLPASVVR